jgi:hypothetical protein
MHAQDAVFYKSGNWKSVEHITKHFPQLDGIPPFALIVKAINPVDGGTLMVSSEQEEVFRILDFIGEEQTNCFQGLLSSINVISQEQIVAFRWESSIFKEPEHVEILAVGVTDNF